MFSWSKFLKNKKVRDETNGRRIYETPLQQGAYQIQRKEKISNHYSSTEPTIMIPSMPIAIRSIENTQLHRRHSSDSELSKSSPTDYVKKTKNKSRRRHSKIQSCLEYSQKKYGLNGQLPDLVPGNSPSTSEVFDRIHVALFDYEARTDNDLSFSKREHLEIIEKTRPNWWHARSHLTGKTGFIPSNFVAKLKSVEAEPWYFRDVTRSESDRLLMQPSNDHGSFLIRLSETRRNEYSLSVRDGSAVKHYKIRPGVQDSVYISPHKVFPCLRKLVENYSNHTYGLCCKLVKPCNQLEKPGTCGLSYNTVDTWQIQRDQIELREKLGSGNFGEVYKGVWNKTTEIAVKTLKKGTATKDEFLAEAQVMKNLRHSKLIQLFGVCTSCEPFYIITEFMKFGSLEKYLRVYGEANTLLEKLSVGAQVASGMSYLEMQNFIHRDLAARNVLVGEGLNCKVADFGLSRILLQDNEYLAVEGSRFAIKWTSPEALYFNRFSIKSDVWSYGVFLMEVFTNGAVPYPEFTNQEVVEKTMEGYRMPRPRYCPREIYAVMVECWHKDPQKRPSFEDLLNTMENFCTILINK